MDNCLTVFDSFESVLEVRLDCYVIRGDNCDAKEYIPREAVRGIVVGFWRSGRYVSVSNRWYRAYSRLWVDINPLVRLCHFWRRYLRTAVKKFEHPWATHDCSKMLRKRR